MVANGISRGFGKTQAERLCYPENKRRYTREAMNRAVRNSIAAAICLGVAVIAWPQSSNDALDSLRVCKETQKLIFENQFVRIIDDQIPVGVEEALHRHPHGVIVYLNTYTNEQTTADGKKTVNERHAGTAAWAEPVVHKVKNIGQTPSHAIRIEMKH
jgi:hypothetical protein